MAKSPNLIQIFGRETFSISFATRDWKVLVPLGDPVADAWLNYFGFYSGGTVAAGLQKEHRVKGNRVKMLEATELLLSCLQRQNELLTNDYAVKLNPGLSGEPERDVTGGRLAGFKLKGKYFSLSLAPGQCRLEESVLEQPEIIDLRTHTTFQVDEILLTIRRRKRDLSWLQVFPNLIAFLRAESSPEMGVVNQHG